MAKKKTKGFDELKDSDLDLSEKWGTLVNSNPVSQLAIGLQYKGLICDVLSNTVFDHNKNDYLLRYWRPDEPSETWVLMGDLGITWEPSRAYPTEELARISIKMSFEDAMKQLMSVLENEEGDEFT